MFNVIVEILEPQGSLKSGFAKNGGKPYAVAEQPAAVHVPNKPYPILGTVPAITKNVTAKDGLVTADVEWRPVGRYECTIVVESSRFGQLEARLLDKTLKPVKAAEVKKAA